MGWETSFLQSEELLVGLRRTAYLVGFEAKAGLELGAESLHRTDSFKHFLMSNHNLNHHLRPCNRNLSLLVLSLEEV